MNIEDITIKSFYSGLIKLQNLNKSFLKFGDLQITNDDVVIVEKSVELRNLINEVRGIHSIEKYKRPSAFNVEVKSLLGEYVVSKLLHKLIKNENFKSNILVRCPPVAEMVLDKSVQDFTIINESTSLTFDVKSQDGNSDKLNINEKSFNRMMEQSTFFLLAYISQSIDHTEQKIVSLYYISNNFFKDNANFVNMSHRSDRTSFYSMPLNLVIKY